MKKLLQLSSGRGPEECELGVSLLFEKLKEELPSFTLKDCEYGRFKNCYKSMLLEVDTCPIESGTILWICKSPFRPLHKRKNWFISVVVTSLENNGKTETKNGIIFETFKSGGKGGQHVNKTESGVRAWHVESGLSATSTDERSQYLNKKTALERLNALLKERQDADLLKGKNKLHRTHETLVRGKPMRTYIGLSFLQK